MRKPLSTDANSGSTRFQDAAPVQSFLELLQAHDFEVKPCIPPEAPVAEIGWSTAHALRHAGTLAFTIEAESRGLKLVAAKSILAGKHPGKKIQKHRNKSQKQRGK
jgi:hypothetical protein